MDVEDLRLLVYDSFRRLGRVPSRAAMAAELDCTLPRTCGTMVVHTCNNQRLFCSESCVQTWLDRTGSTRGYVMDVATLWHFASRWYEGRLERGYVRREPSDAKDYFRSVGLIDPFWGT